MLTQIELSIVNYLTNLENTNCRGLKDNLLTLSKDDKQAFINSVRICHSSTLKQATRAVNYFMYDIEEYDILTVCNDNIIDQEVEKEMEIINKRVSENVEEFKKAFINN